MECRPRFLTKPRTGNTVRPRQQDLQRHRITGPLILGPIDNRHSPGTDPFLDDKVTDGASDQIGQRHGQLQGGRDIVERTINIGLLFVAVIKVAAIRAAVIGAIGTGFRQFYWFGRFRIGRVFHWW